MGGAADGEAVGAALLGKALDTAGGEAVGEADGASIGETVGADDGEAVLKHPNSQNEQRSTAAHGVS